MKCFFVALNFLVTIVAFSQTDTIFYNGDWRVCPRNVASYYRIAEPMIGGGYILTDMYIETNTPQMIVFSTSIEPSNRQGKCTFYYPNGQISAQGIYQNDAKKGKWTYWSETGKAEEEYYGDEPKIKWKPFLYDTLHPFSIALRGKAAGFFIIEDVYFMTFSLGAELAYKRHSLGIDANWFRWRYETDNSDDVGMYSQYELRTYLLADYKFTFLCLNRPELDFYLNLYNKFGNYSMWYDKYEEYDFEGRDMSFLSSTSKGTFNEPGVGFGMRKYAKKTGFGLDVSANYGLRLNDINEHKVISQTEKDFKDHVKSEVGLFYIRINCFYIFGK